MVNGRIQKKMKVRNEPQTLRNEPIIRGPGSTRPYSMETRNLVMTMTANNEDLTPSQQQLLVAKQFPSEVTRRRWHRDGYRQAFQATGFRHAEVLKHDDLILLANYVLLFPKATALEKIAFLWTHYGQHLQNPRFYDESQITRAEQGLGVSRKRCSTTANRAYLPENLYKRWCFFNLAPPFGVAGVAIEDMIDIDEAKIITSHANRKFAKGSLERRCRESGTFTREEGYVFVMAISGRPAAQGQHNRWYKFEQGSGTDVAIFLDFIRSIIADIGPGAPGNRRVFTMDNLNVHKHQLVINAILLAGHCVAFRAPYWPVDGPIEYFFNAYETILQYSHQYHIETGPQLEQATHDIIRSFNGFAKFFQNVFN